MEYVQHYLSGVFSNPQEIKEKITSTDFITKTSSDILFYMSFEALYTYVLQGKNCRWIQFPKDSPVDAAIRFVLIPSVFSVIASVFFSSENEIKKKKFNENETKILCMISLSCRKLLSLKVVPHINRAANCLLPGHDLTKTNPFIPGIIRDLTTCLLHHGFLKTKNVCKGKKGLQKVATLIPKIEKCFRVAIIVAAAGIFVVPKVAKAIRLS